MSNKSKTNFLNELRTLQKSGKKSDETGKSAAEHFAAAYDDAYNYVLKGHHEKMRRAAERNSTRAYLYRWNFERDPSSKRYKFRGVRMLDIVTKGNLIDRLNEHFKGVNSEFYVGWHKFREEDSSKPTRYGIYVSWAEREESAGTGAAEHTESTETTETTETTEDDEIEDDEIEVSV